MTTLYPLNENILTRKRRNQKIKDVLDIINVLPQCKSQCTGLNSISPEFMSTPNLMHAHSCFGRNYSALDLKSPSSSQLNSFGACFHFYFPSSLRLPLPGLLYKEKIILKQFSKEYLEPQNLNSIFFNP